MIYIYISKFVKLIIYIERLSLDNATKSFNIIATQFELFLHNYYILMSQTKLLSDLYLIELLNTLAKSFFHM